MSKELDFFNEAVLLLVQTAANTNSTATTYKAEITHAPTGQRYVVKTTITLAPKEHRQPMMGKPDENFAKAAFTIAVSIGVVVFIWWSAPKVWRWWVKAWQSFNSSTSMSGDVYCKEVKKIVKADPIFEDNGKYEDESYRVTYEDGSVGLIDQAAMTSGYYCVSATFVKEGKTPPKDWVLKP